MNKLPTSETKVSLGNDHY